jgi:hypothetical protein
VGANITCITIIDTIILNNYTNDAYIILPLREKELIRIVAIKRSEEAALLEGGGVGGVGGAEDSEDEAEVQRLIDSSTEQGNMGNMGNQGPASAAENADLQAHVVVVSQVGVCTICHKTQL